MKLKVKFDNSDSEILLYRNIVKSTLKFTTSCITQISTIDIIVIRLNNDNKFHFS